MCWERLAARLMEAAIRRDERNAAEASVELCRSDSIPDWHLFRWDSSEGRFRCILPASEECASELLSRYKSRLEKGETVIDNGVSEPSRSRAGGLTQPRTFLAPLIYQTQFLGVLQGFPANHNAGRRFLAESLRQKLQLISRTWALVELLEDRERLVYIDPLTRLHNAEYLVHFLEKELARCARYQRPIAIVFLDIDWFKRVNDSHGHVVGSKALCELGGLLKECIRDSDAVVRYGGDEFAVILPETGAEGAIEMAERLRERVAEHSFGQDSERSIRITVSAGVSVYPRHGEKVDELVHRADLAMYVAKHSDKNCVKLAV